MSVAKARRRKRSAGAAPSKTLTDSAYTALEEMIVRLELAPGTAVSEGMLSKRLGIGRTPIREALQRLARERLVQILPRRGVIVSDINIKAQLRLLEVRREVERFVASAAARRSSAEEREQFTDLARRFERAAEMGDDVAFLRIDRKFHELCVAASRNEFALSIMSGLQPLSRRFWYQHYQQAGDMPVSAKLHAAVAQAISAGDEQAAARANDALIDDIEAFTRATVSAGL